MKKRTIWKILFSVLLLCIFFSIYFIMIDTVHMGEDFALRTGDIYHTASLQEILSKIIGQMNRWNMRIGEQIAIVFSSLDKSVFNICNTFIIMVYFYLIYIFVTGKYKIDDYKKACIIFILAFALTFLFTPTIGEIFFWIAGSGNYLWSLIIVLLFLVPYRIYLLSEKDFDSSPKKTFILSIFTLSFGFFSGLSNENVSGTALIMLLVLWLYRKIILKKKMPLWAIIGIVSLVFGTLTLLLAPSTQYRVSFYNEVYGVGEKNLAFYTSRFKNLWEMFFYNKYVSYLVITTIVLLIGTFFILWRKHRTIKEMIKNNQSLCISFAILLISTLSVGILILSPYIEKRSFFFFYTFLYVFLIAIFITFYRKKQYISLIISLLILFPSLKCYSQLNTAYETYKYKFEIVDTKIKNAYYEKNDKITVNFPELEITRLLNNRIDYLETNPKVINDYYKIRIDLEV